jgi:UDP-N-acetylglucosamine 2-epimerase (non-hydrolysing)
LTIKVLVVFGTRPEAIKMAPLCQALKRDSSHFETIVCVTAQHREMLDQALEIFSIKPDVDMNVMKEGQDLIDITSSVIRGMRGIFKQYNPDIVLVHGDTTTTLATAIASFYSEIPLGHVEAGLRTNDIWAPYPEEFNRQVVSKATKLHFSPTNQSKNNLLKEGFLDQNIYITGNTVIDSLFWVLEKLENDSHKNKKITSELMDQLCFDFKSKKYILITGHRRENFGKGFLEICDALNDLATKYPDINFVYPVHLNPNVAKPVSSKLGYLKNIYLLEPLNYEAFVYLLKYCYFVITDSGGIQEEAPSLGKPVLVMREVTERPEAVSAGTVRLVGADKQKIINGVTELIENSDSYSKMSLAHNPYGDGHASTRIIESIKKVFHDKI